MHLRTKLAIASSLAVALSFGCASDRQTAESPSTYQQYKQRELASERQEFIQETQQDLNEINNQIARLEARVQGEGQYVSASQRAEWNQEVFELKQDKNRLQAQLQRAQTASPEEWTAMRDELGMAVDTLEAGVATLGNQIAQVFAAEEQPPAPAQGEMQMQGTAEQAGLCSLMVPGIDADVEREGDVIVVELTTSDEQAVDELRRRADQLRQTSVYRPTEMTQEMSTSPSATAQTIEINLTTQNIDDGVRLTFSPRNGDVQMLAEHLEHDAEVLTENNCPNRPQM